MTLPLFPDKVCRLLLHSSFGGDTLACRYQQTSTRFRLFVRILAFFRYIVEPVVVAVGGFWGCGMAWEKCIYLLGLYIMTPNKSLHCRPVRNGNEKEMNTSPTLPVFPFAGLQIPPPPHPHPTALIRSPSQNEYYIFLLSRRRASPVLPG